MNKTQVYSPLQQLRAELLDTLWSTSLKSWVKRMSWNPTRNYTRQGWLDTDWSPGDQMIRKGNRKKSSDCVMMMSMKKDRYWTREWDVTTAASLPASPSTFTPSSSSFRSEERLTSLFFLQSMREVVKGNIMGNMSSEKAPSWKTFQSMKWKSWRKRDRLLSQGENTFRIVHYVVFSCKCNSWITDSFPLRAGNLFNPSLSLSSLWIKRVTVKKKIQSLMFIHHSLVTPLRGNIKGFC